MRLRTILSAAAVNHGVSKFLWKLFHYYNLAGASTVENVPADLPEPALKKKCEENNLTKDDLIAKRDRALDNARRARRDLLYGTFNNYDKFSVEIDKETKNIQLIAVYPDGNETVVFDLSEDKTNLSHKAEIAIKHYFENYMALDAEVKDVSKDSYTITLTHSASTDVTVEADSWDDAETMVLEHAGEYLSGDEIIESGDYEISIW